MRQKKDNTDVVRSLCGEGADLAEGRGHILTRWTHKLETITCVGDWNGTGERRPYNERIHVVSHARCKLCFASVEVYSEHTPDGLPRIKGTALEHDCW